MDTLADYRASTDDAIEQLISSKEELGTKERVYLEKTLKRWQAFAARQGNDVHSQTIQGEGCYRVGQLWQRLGRLDEARSAYEEARRILNGLVQQFPTVMKYQFNCSLICNNLGMILVELGEWEEAHREYEAALSLLDSAVTLVESSGLKAAVHVNLADLFVRSTNDQENAEDHYRQALDLLSGQHADLLETPECLGLMGYCHLSLGNLMRTLSRPAEARKEYLCALEIQEKLSNEHYDIHQYRDVLAQIHANMGALLLGFGTPEQAEASHRSAITIREKLAEEYPSLPQYQMGLARSCSDLGLTFCQLDRPALSLPWFNRSIAILTAVLDQDRRRVQARTFLRDSFLGRAQAYTRIEKTGEAAKDYDKAIELSPSAERPGLRVSRATSAIRAGMVVEAVNEVAELTTTGTGANELTNWNAVQWYDFACIYAVASGKIDGKKQEYADRAMELLQQAVKAGYTDAAHIKQDTDLDPLREREDLKELLKSLQATMPNAPERAVAPPQ